MTKHIYTVGQHVSFDGRAGTSFKRAGVFTITKLLPPVGTELQYRIKSAGEAHERVASEHELQATGPGKPAGTAESQLLSKGADAARVFSGHS